MSLRHTSIRGFDPNRHISFESGERVMPAPRELARYHCIQCGRDRDVPLHEGVAPPPTWRCLCGQEAEYMGSAETGDDLAYRTLRPANANVRTHWDHVRERRTDEELEQTLAKRLDLLRAGRLHLDTELRTA